MVFCGLRTHTVDLVQIWDHIRSLLVSRPSIFLLRPTVSFSLKASAEQFGRGSWGPGVGPGRLLKYLIFRACRIKENTILYIYVIKHQSCVSNLMYQRCKKMFFFLITEMCNRESGRCVVNAVVEQWDSSGFLSNIMSYLVPCGDFCELVLCK